MPIPVCPLHVDTSLDLSSRQTGAEQEQGNELLYQVCPRPDQGSSRYYYPPLQGQCQQEDNAPTYHGQGESVNLPNRGAVAEFQQEELARSSQPMALNLNTARRYQPRFGNAFLDQTREDGYDQ
uniref:Uncharacterized protein n=1 Tax=Timema douglasi TaxID=61478 RepID=A0A7R8VSD6_TIMDO|nr:unnamed protein product [Timema douglasi]